ncbi:MAG TPA: GAF domain-containing sensor histidine kinase [Nitrospira sp.]|nr:GAF domain-containing sensor histidine kinase [Nitrospira sp.]
MKTESHAEAQLAAIERVSHALFHTIDLDELVETTLRIALEEVDGEAGSILLADAETEQLIFQYSIGDKPVPRGTAISWNSGISGAVFQSGSPRLTTHMHEHAGHNSQIDRATGFTTREMITVPLRRWRSEPIGVMNILNKRNGTLNDQDLGLLTIISAFSALAIQQARQFEDAKKAEVVTLLGDIGHDLKNLLTPVQAGVDLLRDVTKDLFDAMNGAESTRQETNKKICDESVEIAQNGIRRLHDRVKEMADCVKGLSSSPDFSACRLAAIVHEVFQTLRLLAKEKQITLLTEGLEILPEIQADERRLYNAFYNLINNAIPETPPGGSITVRGCLQAGSPQIALSVSDTGRGMPAHIRERLFSARAVSTKKGGTGLGTKIVKDVVDAHYGKIWVESEPGIGTTFHMQLPLDPRSTHTKASRR